MKESKLISVLQRLKRPGIALFILIELCQNIDVKISRVIDRNILREIFWKGKLGLAYRITGSREAPRGVRTSTR